MEKEGFYEYLDSLENDELLMVVSIGNQLLGSSINNYLSKKFNEKETPRPLSVHFGRSARLFIYDLHENFDYHISMLNHKPFNWDDYEFPGAFIGKKCVFDAYHFILSNS